MNFKDLQFSIGKFKADVHSQLARSNPLQKQDTKALSLWIFQERNDLASMRTMAYERSETNKALKQWVKEEVEEENQENGRDLEDIVGDKLCRLFDKQNEIDQEFAAKYQQYRHAIKSIREREEKLSDQREKKRSLQSRIANLSKTSPRSPKLSEFQKELKSLEQDTHESEMDLADFKRFALKEAFYLRFNAMNEHAQKTALVAGFGKYLTDLIEIEPTPSTQANRNPYKKGPEAAMIFADAINALDSWKPNLEDERPTLANNTNMDKGKSPVTPTTAPSATNNVPPELPPRRMDNDAPTSPVGPSQPSGYTTNEITSVTGDLKTSTETQIDLDKIDLYDAPPPAYDGPPATPAGTSAPLSSDPHLHTSSASFSSPYQAHTTHLQQPHSPHPSHASLTESPMPMHQQPHHYPPPNQYNHQNSSFYDPSNMMYSQVNYQQLYRHVSQRQQQYAHRPYAEFQQQFNQQQQDPSAGQQQRRRVDAGGFRIPTAPMDMSAEEEKEMLAQHYRQQEHQYQLSPPTTTTATSYVAPSHQHPMSSPSLSKPNSPALQQPSLPAHQANTYEQKMLQQEDEKHQEEEEQQ